MAKAAAPSDLADKFMLRLPDGMRERIASAAKDANRSMNAEIIARLQDSFAKSASANIDANMRTVAREESANMLTDFVQMLEAGEHKTELSQQIIARLKWMAAIRAEREKDEE